MAQDRIHQMQMSFSPLEDRIVFRMSTASHQEYQFWFTRRYTKLLWRATQDMLERTTSEVIPPAATPRVKQALQSFEHQKAVANADFTSEYQHPPEMTRPLGDTPLLLSKIRVKRNEQTQMLCMHPEEGQGIELAMNGQLLHSFISLLSKTLRATDWDLSFSLGDEVTMPSGEKRPLH